MSGLAPRHFCTYFDRAYLLHGLALYRSLCEHAKPFRLHVLCLDRETYDFLVGLGHDELRPIALEDFERGDDGLARAKRNRSKVEYYFTCTPSLPLYVLNHVDGVEMVAYLDSDLYFFSSPQPIYSELGDGSILIIGHRFGEAHRDRERYGIFNVGYLVFRNDGAGRACLEWWRERCIEWCYDIVELRRFADQKYLDGWPERFDNVVVLQHKGANLARWNAMNYELRLDGDSVSVDGQPLIFYHFNTFRIINRWLYDPDFVDYRPRETIPPAVLKFLYGTYVGAIRDAWSRVEGQAPGLRFGRQAARHGSRGRAAVLARLLRRELIFAPGGRILY